MRNVIGQAVVGDDLYGRDHELARLWEMLEQGEHILMLAPRRVGKTSLMLELRRAPRGNWNVIYVDVERGDGPADFVAAVLSALAADHRYRSRFEAIPFSGAVKDVLGRLQSSASTSTCCGSSSRAQSAPSGIMPRTSFRRVWRACRPRAPNLLIIVDELPFLVSRMLRTAERKHDAERLLSRLRYWRQAPELRGKVHTLVGGSIGLEGVLRRASLSGLINDLAPFHLDSWDRPTAVEFLKALGSGCDFRLDDDSIARILDLLRDPVPYHVQLFFSALRDACGSEPSRVSSEMIERCFEERLAGARGTAHLDHYAERLEIAFDEREHEMARDVLGRACRREDGASLVEIEDLRGHSEQTYLSVLRDLEADGYVIHEGSRLTFRSNLLRKWWRKYHHGRGVAP